MGVLERLRDGGFDIAELQVGAVSVKLHRGPATGEKPDRDDEDGGRPSIHQQFGGELYERAVAEKLPGVELQPAIGRRAG